MSLQVDVVTAGTDMHSGMKGGSVANPNRVLAAMLAALHDPATNAVSVPGFYEVRTHSYMWVLCTHACTRARRKTQAAQPTCVHLMHVGPMQVPSYLPACTYLCTRKAAALQRRSAAPR